MWGDAGGGLIHENRNFQTGTQEEVHREKPLTHIKKYDAVGSQFCQHCGAWRGSLGLEPTPELFISHLVQVFAEVKRVLKDSGTLFVNIGDSYSGSGEGGGGNRKGNEHGQHDIMKGKRPKSNLKPKDLVGIPWMLAFALRADGWYLRSDIIWHKPNPMPESVTDRPTKAHEYIFLLSKNKKYFYDAEAVKEPNSPTSGKWGKSVITKTAKAQGKHGKTSFMSREIPNTEIVDKYYTNGRNKRSVWTVTTKPFKEAHFAVFPPDLITPCIKAGSSEHGVCAGCGKPWERVVEKENTGRVYGRGHCQADHRAIGSPQHTGSGSGALSITSQTTGWQPTCKCKTTKRVPATVLDPFGGAGTTAIVAEKFDRSWVLIELSTEYCGIAKARIDQETRQHKLFPISEKGE